MPEQLASLARLAFDYRWSWYPGGKELFSRIDPERWRLTAENPVRLLQETSAAALARAASDAELLSWARALEETFRADSERPYAGPHDPHRPVAFFCAEYGIHQSLPIYSGGLGGLAGDLLKEASDQALPLVAVGLLYRQGYFRQRLEASGRQQESWIDVDPERLPAALVRQPDGRALTITVPIRGSEVTVQVWRVAVGRIPLFLLDADRPENGHLERWITSRLYVGDPATRLSQYALLGVGGVRALAALGIDPGLVHLNEGHAAFAALELARLDVERGQGLEQALQSARSRTVFTTHTPVAAGNETYPGEEIVKTLKGTIAELGVDPDVILRIGRDQPDKTSQPFGVTQFSLRMSRAANAVSERHGEVAREMWQGLWPGRGIGEVPIGHVTNGVHPASWVGRPMHDLLSRHLGSDWWRTAADAEAWAAVDRISDAELWAVRCEQRAQLVEFVKQRSGMDRLAERQPRAAVEAAVRAFDPDVLTIGFARRNATYKRIGLLIENPERMLALLSGAQRIQLVLAGKAHPSDEEAKRVVERLFAFKDAPGVAERVVYLHEYDLGMAQHLVRGCDVWLNLPRPPFEASGTSGMKVVFNGGLNLSVLDGWWAEAYDGSNGWALPGDVEADSEAQDERDATMLCELLEREVVPAFYERDAQGLPQVWLARVRASLRTLAPQFSTQRMLADYAASVYGD